MRFFGVLPAIGAQALLAQYDIVIAARLTPLFVRLASSTGYTSLVCRQPERSAALPSAVLTTGIQDRLLGPLYAEAMHDCLGPNGLLTMPQSR